MKERHSRHRRKGKGLQNPRDQLHPNDTTLLMDEVARQAGLTICKDGNGILPTA
jgi:hypothetical protein